MLETMYKTVLVVVRDTVKIAENFGVSINNFE